ncbi:hypothetical protein TWF696_004485 [Orbilia brochopaga]|uniref:Ribosomal protein/NADH dehydrogenase domain-containing protein n=1 Tax=Orbilia brochopaga TaxID=3140254 RepID=A0AAV9V689_9PEZI
MAARFTFTKQLKELRFHLCQTGAASTPLRSFITKSYPAMKKSNPDIPILIREAQGVPPRVFARYGLQALTNVFQPSNCSNPRPRYHSPTNADSVTPQNLGEKRKFRYLISRKPRSRVKYRHSSRHRLSFSRFIENGKYLGCSLWENSCQGFSVTFENSLLNNIIASPESIRSAVFRTTWNERRTAVRATFKNIQKQMTVAVSCSVSLGSR